MQRKTPSSHTYLTSTWDASGRGMTNTFLVLERFVECSDSAPTTEDSVSPSLGQSSLSEGKFFMPLPEVPDTFALLLSSIPEKGEDRHYLRPKLHSTDCGYCTAVAAAAMRV